MKSTHISATFFLLVACAFGMHSQLNSWDGVIYISNSQILDKNRNPAAIHKNLDFSQLEGSALELRSQRRLIEEATFTKENGKIAIELGHFVTKGEANQKVFACDFYEHVDLVFKAEGTATGGEIPVMKIEAPCKVSPDLNKISAISIPIERILNEKAGDLDLQYDQSATSFHFENMSGSWPRIWILNSVHLYRDSHPSEGIIVGPQELKEINPQPMAIRW